jgi:hypothetical protein
MATPGHEKTVAVAGRGHLRASHADREQMIDTLKAAFVQGRLTKEEFDARVGRALASRTYAELAMVTVGLPAAPAGAQLPRKPPPRRPRNAVAPLPGYEVVALLIACVYFICWLSAGAEMLWQWHNMSVPGSAMCVRCAHTAASHHAPASCAVRLGSLKSGRCPCSGYVPPGVSPKTADLRLLSAR